MHEYVINKLTFMICAIYGTYARTNIPIIRT